MEDEPEDDIIQSSKIVGSFCDKSNQLNAHPPPSKEPSSNDNCDDKEMEDINRKNNKSSKSSNEKEKSTFKHPLVEPPFKLDVKPLTIEEEPSSERKLFVKKSTDDLESLKSVKRIHSCTTKKDTNSRTNLVTPSSTSKEE